MALLLATISSATLANQASTKKTEIREARNMLKTLRDIPSYDVTSLHTFLKSLPLKDANKLVFLRGVVCSKFLFLGGVDSSSSPDTAVVRPSKTNQPSLVLEKRIIQTYDENIELLGFSKKNQGEKVVSKERKQVPFIIGEEISLSCGKYVAINLDNNKDVQFPLDRVSFDKKHIFNRTNNYGYKLNVYETTEEHILPEGKTVTVVGVSSLKNGVPTIKPCQDLPFFMTTKTKDELISELSEELENSTYDTELLSNWSIGLAGFGIGVLVTRIMLRVSK